MALASEWRSRPVFISSTFRDMHAERDYLARYVFSELEERLRARRHDLVPIDLRWGVETLSVDDERAKQLLVLKVCLAEIERSRPFFVGLLGDRYGWVPSPVRMQTAVQEAGFETDVAGTSITALEIEYGALAGPEQRRRCFFYLREPLAYEEMDRTTAARYSDAFLPADRGREACARLAALKGRIEREMPGRVRRYRATWDSTRGRVVGLERFGQQVLEDLWRELDRETAQFTVQAPATWQEAERAGLAEFIHDRTQGFVGRGEPLRRLQALATSPRSEDEGWGACVVGEPGSGKSALFAMLARRLQHDDGLMLLVHAAGASPRSASVDMLLRRWTGELAAGLGVPNPASSNLGTDDLSQAFAELLSQAAASHRIVLLVDGLNQLERTPRARHVTWLPDPWPPNARLIAATVPGTESQSLGRRRGLRIVELAPLTRWEARRVIEGVCARYHRSPHPDVVDALLSKSLPEGGMAAGNPLWLVLAMEELLLLDEDDFARAGELSGTPEEQLHALLMRTVQRYPAQPRALYGTLLERAEDAYGRQWARRFAELIAVSRWGLRESDLHALLPRLTGEPWDGTRLAALRRGYRAHVTQRGRRGQWDFSHAQAREAVLARNLADPVARQRVHGALADHLDSLPVGDPLNQSELMHHLIGADARKRGACYYAGELAPAALEGATQALSAHVLAGSGAEPNPSLDWALSLLDASLYGDEVVAHLCDRYATELLDALAGDATVADRIPLMETVERVASEVRNRRPDSADVARTLGASRVALGTLHRQSGDLERARGWFGRAVHLAEALHGRAPAQPEAARHLAGSLSELADLASQVGQLDDARSAYERSLALTEELCRRRPDSAEDARNLEVLSSRLALVHWRAGDLTQAMALAERALRLAEGFHAQLPGNVTAERDLAVNEERMGMLHQERGELDSAREYFEPALARRVALYQRMPDSVQAVDDVWMSHVKLGDLRQSTGDAAGARSAYEEALSLGELLQMRVPDDVRATRRVADSLHRLGVLDQQAGDLRRARARLSRSEQLARTLYERMPDSAEAARDLAVSTRALGLLDVAAGDLPQARERYERALALTETYVEAAHDSTVAQRDLWVTLDKLAGLEREAGNLDRARVMAKRAVSLAASIHTRSPESVQAMADLAQSHAGVALVRLKAGDIAGARSAYERALAFARERHGRTPGSPQASDALGGVHSSLGLIHLKAGNVARALSSYRRAAELAEEVYRRAPQDPQAAQRMVTAVLGVAQSLAQAGQGPEAQRQLLRCRNPLRTMKRAGVTMLPYLDQLLGQLERLG